ncbi:MAG TPA: DNA glycosylase [Ruminiclostridium sp.]|nr:DNA glycosylase [Ruminiclostridium sp.]
MEYKGYSLKTSDGKLFIENVRDFNLTHIFDCGQCFRWIRQEDGSYRGIAGGRLANVSYSNGTLCITNSNEQDFVEFWYEYFDLGTDYSQIKDTLGQDEIMKEAIETGWGIRLLKQDFWEMLISFIISANNMIPRIMKTVDSLSILRGKCIDPGLNAYSFPDIDALAGMPLEEIQQCKAGFRCKYIHQTSAMIAQGLIKGERLKSMDTAAARKELMKLPGVGPKVADCILLFSGLKYDVFPIDVWVKRVMEELYLKKESGLKEIQIFADKRFGSLTGYAQQYLFYHARLNRIGMTR